MLTDTENSAGEKHLFHVYCNCTSNDFCNGTLISSLHTELENLLGDNYILECRSLIDHFDEALTEGIFSVPTLVKKGMGVSKHIVGNISHPGLIRTLIDDN